jgi:hypothetical protein
MRIITLWNPWATLIADGFKQYETRSWSTQYRGKILIHAAQRRVERADCNAILMAATARNGERAGGLKAVNLLGRDYGCIVAIADLTHVLQMTHHVRGGEMWGKLLHPESLIPISEQTPLERAVGDWRLERYAWRIENVITLPQPIPHKGGQRLRNASDELKQRIQEAFPLAFPVPAGHGKDPSCVQLPLKLEAH